MLKSDIQLSVGIQLGHSLIMRIAEREERKKRSRDRLERRRRACNEPAFNLVEDGILLIYATEKGREDGR